MKKKFIVIVDVEEEDFCESDLEEAIPDGIDNVGNHTLKEVSVKRFKTDKEIREYYCDVCGTTEADKMLNCLHCGKWLGEEE